MCSVNIPDKTSDSILTEHCLLKMGDKRILSVFKYHLTNWILEHNILHHRLILTLWVFMRLPTYDTLYENLSTITQFIILKISNIFFRKKDPNPHSGTTSQIFIHSDFTVSYGETDDISKAPWWKVFSKHSESLTGRCQPVWGHNTHIQIIFGDGIYYWYCFVF